ncbi:MAG: class I SAM-dependent methyltransferase [Holophagaceae bacterium]|nr:class I SAM-dependent methyltransferase [Holophagaceae bacterium]
MSTQTLTHYDQVPYLAKPLPQTHPSHLAAIASMFGLSYVQPKTAKVLELGCASGVNLLGMAHFMPEAQFVGVDLSVVQINEAKRRANLINANNVTYHHMSIDDITPDFGTFDYIIVHGIFSWVPESIQKAILRVCNENLSQDGIAFVSYNVQPGWRMKQTTRDVFMALTPPEMPAHQRHEYGVKWIKDALELTANDEKRPLLHQILAEELDDILTKKDVRYLVHEYLEPNNDPLLFRDFLNQSHEAGLAYLGDAEPASMVRHIVDPRLRKFFQDHPTASMGESEQSVDIISGRTFRQSLLVKGFRHGQIKRALSSASFQHLSIQTRITKMKDDKGEVVFSHLKLGKLNANPPNGTAVVELLAAEAHVPVRFKVLAEKIMESSQIPEEVFGDILFSLLSFGAIELYADPYLPELPKGATPLAILDMQSELKTTSNAFGETITVDPFYALMIPLLKGDWNREEVIKQMQSLHLKGSFNISPQPQNEEEFEKVIGGIVDKASATLKKLGIAG